MTALEIFRSHIERIIAWCEFLYFFLTVVETAPTSHYGSPGVISDCGIVTSSNVFVFFFLYKETELKSGTDKRFRFKFTRLVGMQGPFKLGAENMHVVTSEIGNGPGTHKHYILQRLQDIFATRVESVGNADMVRLRT